MNRNIAFNHHSIRKVQSIFVAFSVKQNILSPYLKLGLQDETRNGGLNSIRVGQLNTNAI